MPYKWGQGGGQGGDPFDDFYTYLVNSPSDAEIIRLQTLHGETLDHLAVVYFQPGNPKGDEFVVDHGGPGGAWDPSFTIDLSPRGGGPRGERLVRVEMWCSNWFSGTYQLNGLRFTKATGPQDHQPFHSPVFGNASGDYVNLDAQANGAICGFYGRHGMFIDNLGIYVRPWSEEP
jgi:hypothetical protein